MTATAIQTASRQGLTREMARDIFSGAYRGQRPRDELYFQALRILGLSETRVKGLDREGRKVTRGLGRGHILTPTGAGRRR